MDGGDRYLASSFAVRPEQNWRNVNEKQCESHQPLNYASALLSAKDVPCKMTEDFIAVNSTYNNEDLGEIEKELAQDTDDNDVDLSLPMSIDEMDCGRISPIQARDVYPLIHRFQKNSLGPRRNIETEVIGFKESHSIDECAITKDVCSCNTNIIFDSKFSSKSALKDHGELAENINCKLTSLNEGNKSIPFTSNSSDNEKYLASMEKLGCPSMVHSSQKDIDIGIPNLIRETRSALNDGESCHTATGEGIAYHGSACASGRNNLFGLSWRMGKKKNSLGECFTSDHCQGQGEPPMTADSLHQSWLKNVKKVHLPDSSLYAKSLDNQRLRFLPILMNNPGHSGNVSLEQNHPHFANSTSVVRKSEHICKMEKIIGERMTTIESTQVIRTPGMETILPLHRCLEIPPKNENVESNLEVNYSEIDEKIKLNESDSLNNVIGAVSNKQEIQMNELTDEIKTGSKSSVVGDSTAEKNFLLTFLEKVQNVDLEEPSIQIKPEKQHYGKENLNEMESDVRLAAKNKAGILGDIHSVEKTEHALELLVESETNATEPLKKEMEDADELDTSVEEINLKNVIDRLLDDIIAKKEVELLSDEGSCMRGSRKNFETHFEESRGELVDTEARDSSDKGVIEKNVQSFFDIEVKNDIKLGKSTEVEPVSHHEIIKISGGEIAGVKNEMCGILVVNQAKASNEETAEILNEIDATVNPVEQLISKSIDSENGEVEEDLDAIQTERNKIFEDKVSDHLLNGVKVNLQDKKKEVEKPQTSGICTPSRYKVCGVNGPNELGDSYNGLKERLESVSFEAVDNLSVEKGVMKYCRHSNDVEHNEIGADLFVGMAEVGHSIPEGVYVPNVAAVAGERSISSNSIKAGQGNNIIPKEIVVVDAKDTTLPKTVISKELEGNNYGHSFGVSEGNQSESVMKSINIVNDEEANRSHETKSAACQVIPIVGDINCLNKESFFCFTHLKSDKNECLHSQGEDKCECSSESNSFCRSEIPNITSPKNFIGYVEANASHSDNGDEVIVGTVNETNKECACGIRGISCLEIPGVPLIPGVLMGTPEYGSSTPKSDVENKMLAKKDSIMMVENIVLDDCSGGNNNSCEGNVESYAKEGLIQAQVATKLPNDLSHSKPISISEAKAEECDGDLINSLFISHQPYTSCEEISKLKESDFGDENDSLSDGSSIDELHEMKSAIGKSNHEDHKICEKQDTGDELNGSLDLYASECTPNDSLELNEMNVVEASDEVINQGRWFSSTKRKDYMISGIELIRDYSLNDSECLDSGNEIDSSLETGSGEANLSDGIQNIDKNLKTSGDYLSVEFSQMVKSPSIQLSILISDEPNEEDSDLNIASDDLCLHEENGNIESDNTIKSGTALKSMSSPKDIALSSELPDLGLSEICNFDSDDKEIKNTTDGEKSALSPLSIVPHENKSFSNLICKIKYEEDHQKFDIDDCLPKLPNVTSVIESIHDGIHEHNHIIDSQLEEKKSECASHDGCASFVHENVMSFKSIKPKEDGMFMVHGNAIENSVKGTITTSESLDFESSMIVKVKNDDHQIVPDGTDNMATEEDYVPIAKEKLFAKAPDKTESETNRNISNIADDESSSFSLDLYLDTVVDKQLPFENASDHISGAPHCDCLQFVDAGCQTQLCGLLNTIHSCKCLEAHLFSNEKLDDFKFGGRKRQLQALNLEDMGKRNKKVKMVDEAITNEILSNDEFPKNDNHSEKECAFDLQQRSSYFSHETKPINVNAVNVYGVEATSKDDTQLLKKLPENDWEEICDLDEGVRNKELPDQKVPDVEILPDSGLEARAPRMNVMMQGTHPRSMSSFSNIYSGSKVLRLGLSKRAKLRRLHQQK